MLLNALKEGLRESDFLTVHGGMSYCVEDKCFFHVSVESSQCEIGGMLRNGIDRWKKRFDIGEGDLEVKWERKGKGSVDVSIMFDVDFVCITDESGVSYRAMDAANPALIHSPERIHHTEVIAMDPNLDRRWLEKRLDKIDENFDKFVEKADEKADERFDKFVAKVDERFEKADEKADERFDKFVAKVDERFEKADEKADERFDKFAAKVDEKFEKADERFDKFAAKADEKFEKADEKFDKMNESLTETRVSVARIEGILTSQDAEKGLKVNKAMVFITACSVAVSLVLGVIALL
ncbi:MAG: hypothetical protein ISN28_01465 [Ectothiorhodospiraceae bacterium AqS1]|nr:hypothetical protein [Ectothiorhodospiraceae bacterium AqS1]